jgi:hypothetical protein
MSVEHLPEPPQPPDVRRRIRLYPYQWIGLGLLALVPVLAIGGFFGEALRTERSEDGGVELVVTYPSRLRYLQLHQIQIRVVNGSAAPLDTLRLSLDSALANRFLDVTTTPSLERPYELTLTDLLPGEERLALVDLRANEYGRHEGDIRVSGALAAPDSAHAQGSVRNLHVPLSIRVFP